MPEINTIIFYQWLLDRYNVKPEETLFIDDNLRNVKAAEEIGITSRYFSSPEQLKSKLKEMNIL